MIAERSGRTLALAEWLRALRHGGFELELRGGAVLRGAPVQMTLVDDLEVVAIEAPAQKESPAVVARKGARSFVIACSSAESAQALLEMALDG